MAWSGEKELTEGQLKAAEYAGIPDNRPGLYAEYPKAVYKEDKDTSDRTYLNEPLLVANKFAVRMATVNDEVEEIEAIEQGWSLSPDIEADAARRAKESAKDDEIAALRAELAGRDEMAGVEPAKRGPGRPPRALD